MLSIIEYYFNLLFVWSILGVTIFVSVMDGYNVGLRILNPKCIYEVTNVNYFGCAVLTILLNLLCPIVTICYWFYILCTVGRK